VVYSCEHVEHSIKLNPSSLYIKPRYLDNQDAHTIYMALHSFAWPDPTWV